MAVSRREGRWVLDFYDQHKQRRRIPMPEGTKKADAEKELAKIMELVSTGAYVPHREMPTFAELAEDWLKAVKPGIQNTTYAQYEQHVRVHLVPFFGQLPVNRIGFQQTSAYVSRKVEDGKPGRATISKTLTTLASAMKYASRCGYCDFHPGRDKPTVPKDVKKMREAGEKEQFFTHEEIRKLLDAALTEQIEMLIFVAAITGVRQGELLGLKWEDVDFKNRQLNVRRTYNHGEFRNPKSRTSYRAIDLGMEAVTRLKKWKLACPPNELDLIFPSQAGTPINSRNLMNRIFEPMLKELGIPPRNWHALRHSYASMQIERGAEPKYLQKQLGHSSIQVTFDRYGHLMKRFHHDEANALEESLFGKNGH